MDFPNSVPGVGLVNGKFADEDPLAATPGSLIPSAWGNSVTLELLEVIRGAGLVPDEEDNAQVLAAILKMAAAAVKFATQAQVNAGSSSSLSVAPKQLSAALQAQTHTAFNTGGATPAFTLTPVPAVEAYAAKQRFQVTFGAAGGAAPTLNVSELGARNLKQYSPSGAKVAAVITANFTADVVYDGTDFIVLDPLAIDAMPVAGGAYRPTLNGVAVKLNGGFDLGQPGGYITYGDGDGGLASAMTFVANGGGTGVQAFGGFTWRVVSLNNTSTGPAMTYTYNGRLTVPTEISVPKIISNTEAPTQAVGYAGQYISNCAFVAASINAIPKDTTLLTANGWSKNGTTGEIIQWCEYVIGDAQGATSSVVVTWPFQFPSQCLNIRTSFRVASGSPSRMIASSYALTTTGTTILLEEASTAVQSGLVLMIEVRGN